MWKESAIRSAAEWDVKTCCSQKAWKNKTKKEARDRQASTSQSIHSLPTPVTFSCGGGRERDTCSPICIGSSAIRKAKNKKKKHRFQIPQEVNHLQRRNVIRSPPRLQSNSLNHSFALCVFLLLSWDESEFQRIQGMKLFRTKMPLSDLPSLVFNQARGILTWQSRWLLRQKHLGRHHCTVFERRHGLSKNIFVRWLDEPSVYYLFSARHEQTSARKRKAGVHEIFDCWELSKNKWRRFRNCSFCFILIWALGKCSMFSPKNCPKNL